jgi:hypothetical protein
VSVLLGNGNGTFQTRVDYPVGEEPTSVAVADLNGDGHLDLIVTDGQSGFGIVNAVSVLLGNGNGTFRAEVHYPAGGNPTAVAVADLDGDGALDVVVANEFGSTVSVLSGNGDGTLKPQIYFGTGTEPTGVAVADLNRDGVPDIATISGTGLSVLLATCLR